MCQAGRRGEAAVRTAAELVRRHSGRLTLASIVDLPGSDRGCLPMSAWRDTVVVEAYEELDRISTGLDMPVGRAVLAGRDSVLDQLEDLECDLLLLPARGGLRLGRDPYGALRHAQGLASFPVTEPGDPSPPPALAGVDAAHVPH